MAARTPEGRAAAKEKEAETRAALGPRTPRSEATWSRWQTAEPKAGRVRGQAVAPDDHFQHKPRRKA